MTRGDLGDHARDLRAIEWGQRDYAMMRAQASGRAKLQARGRDDQERRLHSALGERVHEIERSRIGPVQVLEGEHDRLRPRARQNPGCYRLQLPASQSFRSQASPTVLG
jgi:streptomycin 6-kinase